MSDQQIPSSSHDPSGVRDIKWWSLQLHENWVSFTVLGVVVGGAIFGMQDLRYKDIVEGLKTQIGTKQCLRLPEYLENVA
jgi:hypothetical protein